MARKSKKSEDAEPKKAPKKKAAKKDAPAKSAPTQTTPTETAPTNAQPEGMQPEAAQGPALQVLAQYIKDVSFENPNAPGSLRANQPAPEVGIGIEVRSQPMDDDTVEVSLLLKAEARRDTGTAFICELDYAGLFAFQGVTVETLQPMVLIECPRLLFPFARQIMAQLTQEGGFPPIRLDPPDFAAMFRDTLMRRAQEQGMDGAMGAPQGSA